MTEDIVGLRLWLTRSSLREVCYGSVLSANGTRVSSCVVRSRVKAANENSEEESSAFSTSLPRPTACLFVSPSRRRGAGEKECESSRVSTFFFIWQKFRQALRFNSMESRHLIQIEPNVPFQDAYWLQHNGHEQGQLEIQAWPCGI